MKYFVNATEISESFLFFKLNICLILLSVRQSSAGNITMPPSFGRYSVSLDIGFKIKFNGFKILHYSNQ